MATSSKRQRRLWDAYHFPGFRPQLTVRGVFGDPRARVIEFRWNFGDGISELR
jgi:hypothetical protein